MQALCYGNAAAEDHAVDTILRVVEHFGFFGGQNRGEYFLFPEANFVPLMVKMGVCLCRCRLGRYSKHTNW